MGLRIRDLAGERVQVNADPTLGAVVEATDKTLINSFLTRAAMSILARMFSLPKGLISLTVTIGPGALIRVQTKGYKMAEDKPMTAVQAMEVAERIKLAQISDAMRAGRFSIDMDKAKEAFAVLDEQMRTSLGVGGIPTYARKLLEGSWGSMGEPVDEAESQVTQRHMMATTEPEAVHMVTDRKSWPSWARPGTAEDTLASTSCCADCRQAETCKRIDTCVAHNCAFGEASPP